MVWREQWQWPFSCLRTLALLALLAVGGCASQAEMVRLQGQVVELRKQLEYEKQRLKQATEEAGSNAEQQGR